MEKKPYLTRDDVLRFRATVDAEYERDVESLTGDTTDDLAPIRERHPVAGAKTTASVPIEDR